MEKKVMSSGKMTFKFIWHFILYVIVLALITGFLYSLLYNSTNLIIMNIIKLILSGVSIFIATKLSLKDIFAENTLNKEDGKKYKRNIIIFFILCILVTLFYYALLYAFEVYIIDGTAAKLVIADNQDITEVLDQAKNIQLAITSVIALAKSFIYIGMMKYQDKYINSKE